MYKLTLIICCLCFLQVINLVVACVGLISLRESQYSPTCVSDFKQLRPCLGVTGYLTLAKPKNGFIHE